MDNSYYGDLQSMKNETQVRSSLYVCMVNIKLFTIYYDILFSFTTRAGSPQQREPITVGPYYLSHPVNIPCGRKPEYPEKTHDFRQSVDFTLFT